VTVNELASPVIEDVNERIGPDTPLTILTFTPKFPSAELIESLISSRVSDAPTTISKQALL